MNQDFRHHYNNERPNQAPTCQNQPPRHAFPVPPILPPLPDTVDPDRWLNHYDGRLFKRRVNANGSVQLDKDRYYIRPDLHKQWVWLQIDAPNRQLHVLLDGKIIKTIPIKGLLDQPLPFNTYLKLIKQQAVSQWRLYLQSARRYVQIVT